MPKRTFFRLDEDKRERVIRAAIDEFRKNGYENSKVGAIAQNANIANGSIYQYFEDKRELFLYCVNWTVENFIRELDRQMPLAGMELFEYLLEGLPGRVAYWMQEPELAMFAHDLTDGAIDFPPGEINTVRELYGSHIPKLIANGQKWGSLRDDLDDDLLALFVKGVVRETEELIYSKSVGSGFALTEDQVGSNAEQLGLIVQMLKSGLSKMTAPS
ncbi:MAG: TetR/AcrR family transcriptional regulator [Oscillospiraceae bacterium]|nr:TetR/AcrR family transcriptional regulator [Oscillospiraceae bacterium]